MGPYISPFRLISPEFSFKSDDNVVIIVGVIKFCEQTEIIKPKFMINRKNRILFEYPLLKR